MTHAVIRQIEFRGCSVGVHETEGYVEMRAEPLAADKPSHVVRRERNADDALQECAVELAVKVGLRPEV